MGNKNQLVDFDWFKKKIKSQIPNQTNLKKKS